MRERAAALAEARRLLTVAVGLHGRGDARQTVARRGPPQRGTSEIGLDTDSGSARLRAA
jgi:hypothetical protein